jgi:sugar phosphate isomerase/epimerase
MKIALATTILSGWSYPHELFAYSPTAEEREPLFQWARRVGFDGVDVADSWMDWYAMSQDQLEDMRAQLDRIGLSCAALNPYRCILVKHPSAGRNEEKLHRSLEVARIWGAGLLNLALSVPFPAVWSDAERAQRQNELARGEDYSDRDFQQTATKLRKLAAAAKKLGIDLSIELHDDGMTDQSQHVMRLHGLVDRPNVGVNPDLENGYRVPYPTESWRSAIERLAPATNLWHVKSCTRRYVPETGRYQSGRASLRDGDIDYRWALTKIAGAGFDGWLSVESGGGDALHHAEGDLRYLRELIGEWLPLYKGEAKPRVRRWGWGG